MTWYRFYLIVNARRIPHDFQCKDDGAAMVLAHTRLIGDEAHIEVWRSTDLVGIVSNSPHRHAGASDSLPYGTQGAV